MKSFSSAVTLIVALVLINAGTYTVPEHQQALVFQLGRVIGQPITDPGLHFKVPFLHDVRFFDKRILQWDGERGEIPTLDKKFIWVDTTARWKISDALKFYQSVRDINNALPRIGSYINGATKDIISDFNLIESVRDSNKIIDDIEQSKQLAMQRVSKDPTDTAMDELTTSVEKIEYGREKLSKLIVQKASKDLVSYGIDLIDVQIRSIAYKEVVEQRVYERMISEREKIATKIRSTGKGENQKIMGELDLALKKIESEAYKQSQTIKGKADAEAQRILTHTLKSDPEFYEFVKTLETYKQTMSNGSEFILSTQSEFLKLFR